MTEHERRWEAAIQEMKDAGLWDRPAGIFYKPMAPVRARLRRYLPPAHYMPFMYLSIILGFLFGPPWGASMYLVHSYGLGYDVQFQSYIFPSFAVGALFGLTVSVVTRYERKRHNLSRWDDL